MECLFRTYGTIWPNLSSFACGTYILILYFPNIPVNTYLTYSLVFASCMGKAELICSFFSDGRNAICLVRVMSFRDMYGYKVDINQWINRVLISFWSKK